jgi:hypothetical protein
VGVGVFHERHDFMAPFKFVSVFSGHFRALRIPRKAPVLIVYFKKLLSPDDQLRPKPG